MDSREKWVNDLETISKELVAVVVVDGGGAFCSANGFMLIERCAHYT